MPLFSITPGDIASRTLRSRRREDGRPPRPTGLRLWRRSAVLAPLVLVLRLLDAEAQGAQRRGLPEKFHEGSL